MRPTKTFTFLSILSLAAFVAGCKTPPGPLTKAVIQESVYAATAFGVEQAPEAVPEIRIAETVICSQAHSTNVEPSQLVAQLQAAGVGTNAYAKLILNSIIGIYNGAFAQFGESWAQSIPVLQSYLESICSGMQQALPSGTAVPTARRKSLPPHLL